jgi:fructose-bisphosphate aldolase class I
MFYTAPIGEAGISGAIMFKETLHQAAADGTSFVDCLTRQGVMPGIKVDEVGSRASEMAQFTLFADKEQV